MNRYVILSLLCFCVLSCLGTELMAQTTIDLSDLKNEEKRKAEDKVLALIPGKVQGNYGHKAGAAVLATGTYTSLASTIACGALWAYNDRKFKNTDWDRSHYANNASSFRTATLISAGAFLGFYIANYVDAIVVSKRENRKPISITASAPSSGDPGIALVMKF